MGAFTLASEQTEHLDRPVAEATEPVRHPRVELDRLAGGQDEVLIAEHQPEPAVQDVQPLIAFVGPDMFRSAEELAASLDPGDWDVVVAAALDRSAMVDGEPVTFTDSVLRAARRP